jgi:hypothetical protein
VLGASVRRIRNAGKMNKIRVVKLRVFHPIMRPETSVSAHPDSLNAERGFEEGYLVRGSDKVLALAYDSANSTIKSSYRT